MNTKDPNENPKSTPEVAPPVKAAVPAPDTTKGEQAKKSGSRIGNWWRDKGFTRTLEVIITIATIVSAAVAYVQWKAMERSNGLTRQSLVEARRSADAAVEAVKESRRQFDLQRQDAADAAREERERFAATLMEQKSGATNQQQAARKSLEESRRALEISQRARIGVETISDYSVAEGTKGSVTVTLRNAGHVPATNVRFSILTRISSANEPEPEPPINPGGILSKAVLIPGSAQPLTVGIVALNSDQVNAVRAATARLWVVGRVTYDDGFGRHRTTTFCLFHTPEGVSWNVCSRGNEAD